ncbi:unnamed protein product [Caenorhabditis auriculariae]|uniref:Uncharacterized protein n=1 Tax=Caenorhabditis auriculariae TaxID=2777116 RepID=A0A8S1HKA2_9PELO|nr:unnamed protein product [Caenorhabditis auriculariae]
MIPSRVADDFHGVPIFDASNEKLFIPRSMSDDIDEKIRHAGDVLHRWSDDRKNIVNDLLKIADDVDSMARGCAISTVVGSTVGVGGGAAVIGGLILMPPVAVAGLVVGTFAAASNLVTGATKIIHLKMKMNVVKELLEKDQKALEELEATVKAVLELINSAKAIGENDSIGPKELLNNVLSGGAMGTMVAGMFVKQTARFSTSLALRATLHAAAAVGIVLDSISLISSALELKRGEASDAAKKIRDLASDLENHRKDVNTAFMNKNVWDYDDDLNK